MGGIQIDVNSNIVKDDGQPIQGLFAAGEVAGGVHGKNRLGGSGLLGCVVFGRVSGASASKHLLKTLTDPASSSSAASRRLGGLGRQLQIIINLDGGDASVHDSSSSSHSSSHSSAQPVADHTPKASEVTAPAPAKSSANASSQKSGGASGEYSADEVAKHNTDKDCWVIVNDQVLDVTGFLDRHPGGKGSIMLFAGRDASEEFNMLHKPDVISKFAPEVIIGKLKK